MRWHFRGGLSHIEIRQGDRLLLPFAGCAWLEGPIGPEEPRPVFAAFLEVVRRDDLLIRAIRDDAAAAARRRNAPAADADGCLYCLGNTVHVVLGLGDDAMDEVQRALMAPLPTRDFFVNVEVDFPGFAGECGRIEPGVVTRKAFLAGQCAIHFAGCELSVGYGDAMAVPIAAVAHPGTAAPEGGGLRP
jgi:hypothetical protein